MHPERFHPSFALTLTALAALAYVMASADSRSLPRATIAVKDRLRTTSNGLLKALEAFEALQREGPAAIDRLGQGPAAAEEMTSVLDDFKRARDRVLQATQMFELAMADATPHAAALGKSMSGWNEAIAKVREMVVQLRAEMAKVSDEGLGALRQTAAEILVRSLAETGVPEWAASLPEEEEPLFDEADVVPVHWDEAQGGLVQG
jgi:hypothetical protein